MDRERFQRVGLLFERAGELGPHERSAFLERECESDPELRREVEDLLAQDRRADFDAVLALFAADLLAEEPPHFPERIAGYSIRGILGQGGMAIVYRAEQEHPRRAVALKVIRLGANSGALVRRFQHEAQVLALLGHPGIAQVYEAGNEETPTGPMPWLAMELVEGSPLLEHVRRNGVATRDRVRLLVDICDAVHHAHQKGVIHRDIKPANVMVDHDGRVKVLDFGIARVTGGDLPIATLHTQAGELIGTLPYMSPEQTRGDPAAIDTRTDVYSLGALAYELLCDHKPIELSLQSLPECLRRIEEVEPLTLGKIDAALDGDIETIIAKALAKDRGSRYSSVAELAADLRRHLADEPILARPPTTVAQIRRFARKNRTLVGGIVATFLALVSGFVATALQMARTRAEAERAQNEAHSGNLVKDFLARTYEEPSPDIAAWLDRDVARAEANLESESAVQAEVLGVIGRAYLEMGYMAKARTTLQRSADIWDKLQGDPSFALRAWKAHFYLANYHFEMFEPAEAADLLEDLLGRLLPMGNLVGKQILAEVYSRLALVRLDLGQTVEAREARDLALALLEDERPDDPFRLENLLSAAASRGEEAEVDRLQRQLVEVFAEHPTLQARMRVDLAAGLIERARKSAEPERTKLLAEGEQLCRVSLAFELGFGERYPRLAHTYQNLSVAVFQQGRREEGVELCRKAIDLRREFFGPDHPDLAMCLRALGIQLEMCGRQAESLAPLEESHRIYSERGFADRRVESAWELAGVFQQMNRFDEAVPWYEEVLVYRRENASDPAALADCLAALAVCEQARGRPQRAEVMLEQCLELRRRIPDLPAWKLASVEGLIGEALLRQGRTEEARTILERVHADLERQGAPESRLAVSRHHLDDLRAALEKQASAPIKEGISNQ